MIRRLSILAVLSCGLWACEPAAERPAAPGASTSVDPAMKPASEPAAPTLARVTIAAEAPDGVGDIYLTGNLDSLGPWKPDAMKMEGAGTRRTASLDIPVGQRFEYKFTLGSWDREALGPSGMVMPNNVLDVAGDAEAVVTIPDFKKDPAAYIADWKGSGVLGELIYWTDTPSAHLDHPRHVSVWLPPEYAAEPERRFPVIYMSDGQNLFDPRIANTGSDWGVDEAMVRLTEAGEIEPAIVVATWSTPSRGKEYSPWHDAPRYARFVLQELMPRVNAEFRTLTGPENTFHMGSSMGGLLSFYFVTNHPDIFGGCGCVSTHFPLSEAMATQYFTGVPKIENPDQTPYILGDIEAGLTAPDGVRMWFDYGTLGLDAEYGPTHEAVRAWLLANGRVEGEDFVIRPYEGADHNEASWRARLDDPLRFLLAK